MKIINNLIEKIDEEVESAEDYADKFIENKAKGNMSRAQKYREMSTDELRHAENVRDFSIADMESVRRVYSPSEEDLEHWERSLHKINERIATIHRMLSP